jgi:UDP-3-O-[3-hydroxymyristoyl] glucosamine N-acyltransferase
MSWRPRRLDHDRGAERGLSPATIAARLGGELVGASPEDGDLLVSAVRPPELAGPGHVAVVLDGDAAVAEGSRAALLVIGPLADGARDAAIPRRLTVRVGDPRRALADLLDLLHPLAPAAAGVHPDATVAPGAQLGPGVAIGPGARVEEGVRLGARVEIHANAVIGVGCVLGEDTVIHPNVTLYPGTRLGARVEIQSGTVIGAPGFGLLRGARGAQRSIAQIGIVLIEDDVSIGANCAIDRATLDTTVIGHGTRIDNLVQIGHNSRIGADCCIVAQTGIAGSVKIGDRCVLLAQSGVKDHLVLEDDVYLGAQAGAANHLTTGEWLGTPALPAPLARRVLTGLRRLPDLLREVRALRRAAAARERSTADGDPAPIGDHASE